MMSTAQVGATAPEFCLQAVAPHEPEPRQVRLGDYAGRWLALLFYPRDFSFVCPTELTAFSARIADFQQRDCELLGISVDTIELHWEWLATPPDAGGVGPLRFPLASDPAGTAAQAYGVWVPDKRVSTRGLFLINPEGVLQYTVVHSLSVGRTVDEVLRVLDALQTGGLCPSGWTMADGTVDVERALQPGRILGHYRIRRKLGGGSFGTVFAAWDLQLERPVALKILLRDVIQSRQAVLHEARAAARLNHPHICTIYSVEQEDGLPLITMEYLEGRLLSRAIAEGLQRALALRVAGQIASGLAAAHAQQIVHGDLKPANVILSDDGTAKILDFGLASSQPEASSSASTGVAPRVPGSDRRGPVSGTDDPHATWDLAESDSEQYAGVRGTPAYMSPEQAAGLPATPASDVFSFGLTLFELLTARQALTEASPVRLLRLLRYEDLRGQFVPQVEAPYRELLSQLLARVPAERPAMPEVFRRLQEAIACECAAAGPTAVRRQGQ